MSLRLFVLRHGETVFTRERRFAGWRDVPLTDAGLRQIDAAAAALNGVASSAVLETLRADHDGESVVLVTHAVVIRLIVLDGLGLGPARLWSIDASPAGITELEYRDDWVTVHRMNTLAHLGAEAER